MGKTSDKLNYLDETKEIIKQAIIEKGETVSDKDTFRSYGEKIKNIKAGEDLTAELTAQDIALTELEEAVNNLPDAGGGTGSAKLIEGQATQNGEYWARDYGADGFEVFTVNVSNKVFQPQGTIVIEQNGVYDVYDFETAEVRVPTGGGVGTGGSLSFYNAEIIVDENGFNVLQLIETSETTENTYAVGQTNENDTLYVINA